MGLSVIHPRILSVSRATDIPAFYSDWFMKRLRQGWCLWKNPFNPTQIQKVVFTHCRAVVFWSKNPAPLFPFLREMDERGLSYSFQFTLNDYEEEGLEPCLPPLIKRIDIFQRLSEQIGPHRVIWRFDPLIVGKKLSVSSILEKIGRLGTALSAYTERLIFSFLDPYKKAMNKLHAIDPSFRPPTNEEETALAEGIARLNSFWPHSLSLATCAETADFEKLGIQHAACIDPSLLLRINPEDSDLAKLYAGTRQCHFPGAFSATRLYIKDSGQRKLCNCAPSKDIGAYGTCPHMCTYCYANTSSARTLRFFTAHDSDSSLLI